MRVEVAEKVDDVLLNHSESIRALIPRRQLKVRNVSKTESERDPVVLQRSVAVVYGNVFLNILLLPSSRKKSACIG